MFETSTLAWEIMETYVTQLGYQYLRITPTNSFFGDEEVTFTYFRLDKRLSINGVSFYVETINKATELVLTYIKMNDINLDEKIYITPNIEKRNLREKKLINILNDVEIYSDGSAQPNPGKGGYGIVLISGEHRKEISQGFVLSTNNRMELLGAIVGIESVNGTDKYITLTTDSKYVVDAVGKGWIYNWEKNNFKGRTNSDLWKRLLPLLKKHNITFKWIKGHNNHPENEICDGLAVNAANSSNLLEDIGYKK